MRVVITQLLCSFLLSSCTFLLNDWEDLGGGYFILKDGFNTIMYNSKNTIEVEGYLINGGYENVVSYNSGDRYIIYRTSFYTSKNSSTIYRYWLIDKNVPINIDSCIDGDTVCFNKMLYAGLIGPLDSTSFYKKLEELNIELQLKSADR